MLRRSWPLALGAALAGAAALRRPAAALVADRLAASRRSGPDDPHGADSRLYAKSGVLVEAHLARRGDGGLAVVALSLDGRPRRTLFAVARERPWDDFEHQAGLRHAAWGPCRGVDAGM